MFQVQRQDEGFTLYFGNDEQIFYANEKKLIAGIRALLGLKRQGRPFRKEAENAIPF